jgi:hypothetical protein
MSKVHTNSQVSFNSSGKRSSATPGGVKMNYQTMISVREEDSEEVNAFNNSCQ